MMSSGIVLLLASYILSLLALTKVAEATEATKGKRLVPLTNQVTYDMHTQLAINILLQ
jgi:hypothetical protein